MAVMIEPSVVPNFSVAGRACLPPNLVAALGWADKNPSPAGTEDLPQKPKTLIDNLQQVREMMAEIAMMSGMAWQMQSYVRYSRGLKSEFAAHHHPNELQRFVFDANGRLEFPSHKNLVLTESRSNDYSKASEAALAVYNQSGIIHAEFRKLLDFLLPQPLIALVNFNTNAMNDGFNNAAFMNLINMGLPFTMYGEGVPSVFKNFALPLDVKAHEYGHFFLDTAFPKKFPYMGQPGAINEHLADVIGICVTAHVREWTLPYPEDNWKLGAELMVQPNASLRHLLKPGTAFDIPGFAKDIQPATMKDFKITGEDNGGVHINSGIMNRLFALFTIYCGEHPYQRPLKIWLRAMTTVRAEPNFAEFGKHLKFAAREFGLEKEFNAAAREAGIFDFEMYRGKITSTRLGDTII